MSKADEELLSSFDDTRVAAVVAKFFLAALGEKNRPFTLDVPT